MSEPASTELVIGRITGAYGIKGWVKIHSYTDPMENFLEYGGCTLKSRQGNKPVEFDQGRRQGKGLVAHIVGVDDRNEAELLRGVEISVPRLSLPDLEEGDYYWHQLQGLEVWCTEGDERYLLGTVDYLIETGANDVLVVKPCEGSVDDEERLLPYLPDDVVTGIDLAAGTMSVDWARDY